MPYKQVKVTMLCCDSCGQIITGQVYHSTDNLPKGQYKEVCVLCWARKK